MPAVPILLRYWNSEDLISALRGEDAPKQKDYQRLMRSYKRALVTDNRTSFVK